MRITDITLGAAFAFALGTGAAQAETILSAASAFPEGHQFSVSFEQFIEEFNAASGGEVKIDYKGGAPAIGSPFTLGERVQRGQFDMMNITGPYYESTVPVSLALSLTTKPITELRQTDWIVAMQEAHEARGLHYLGQLLAGVPFHLYTRKPIDTADLTGLRLRVAPHYQPFFGGLGATTMRSDLSEVYTLMENGSIDGFGWPIIGFLPDWMKITPYRIDPGFYSADLNLVVNLESWDRLTEDQKKLFNDLIAKYEAASIGLAEAWSVESKARMAAAGMQAHELQGAERDKFLEAATESAWATVISRDPEIGNRLRKAMDGQ